ncbi:MAG: terminase large subunit [Pirellulales bacterium]
MNILNAVSGFKNFLAEIFIPTDRGPYRVAEITDSLQLEIFDAIAPGLKRVIEGGENATFADALIRFYLEMPRGHAKTTFLALIVIYLCIASPRRLIGVIAAADQDQARLVRDTVLQILSLPQNLALRELIEIQQNKIVNVHNGCEFSTQSSDVNSSWGLTVDCLLLDEVAVWKSRDFWDSLISTAAKKAHCLVVVCSNAGMGMGTSFQWFIRESARTSPSWKFISLDGPKASWITPDRLEEQRHMLPPAAFNRVWLNQWSSGGDLLEMSDIEAACTEAGPLTDRDEYAATGFTQYLGALDLGLKNDRSALVVLGIGGKPARIRLVGCQAWSPPIAGGQIRLEEVKEACLSAHRRFRLESLTFDPWQCALMAEQLSSAGLRMVEMPFTAGNLDKMATTLLAVFRNRQISMYRDEELIRDLCRLSIVERQQGFRLVAARDEFGHADKGIALSMGLVGAAEILKNDTAGPIVVSADSLKPFGRNYGNGPISGFGGFGGGGFRSFTRRI